MMAWLNPSRWLMLAALMAALAVGYFEWAHHQQLIGYNKAHAEYAAQARAVDGKREAIAEPIAEKQAAAQVQIRTVTKTLIEKVPVYVKADSDCTLPGGYRLLHDAAAANVQVPDAARITDAAPVPADIAATTTITNYGACHETAARLTGLQDWVRAQRGLKY